MQKQTMTAELASVRVIVYGQVQGVFFRMFAAQKARNLGLTGYVRNLPSGNAVEVQAEGDREKLERLIQNLKLGPPGASVKKIAASWSKYGGLYPKFDIRY